MTYPDTFVTCPACGFVFNDPDEVRLGVLGFVTWYRCRYCGMDWRETP